MKAYMIICDTIKKAWKKISKGPIESFHIYWDAYGKKNALFRSLYFWLSIIFTMVVGILNLFYTCPWEWHKDVISVIPTIFGFSLGGFAILVGFGNEEFRKNICSRSPKKPYSIYMRVNASFFHFIFVQFLCLFYTIIIGALKLDNVWIFYIFGIFLFIYSLFTIIAIAFAVLRLARWFDMLYSKKHS